MSVPPFNPAAWVPIVREVVLGITPTPKTLTLADGEQTIFNVAGGAVLLTHLWGEVTTAVTVANSAKLVYDPTVGGTDVDLCATLDIGTTDSAVGSYFTITGTVANAMVKTLDFTNAAKIAAPLLLRAGAIHMNNGGTGCDGEAVWNVIYVPLTSGATIVAA